MKKLLLLGDEALAQGVLDAGLSGVYGYPGTPSTEITEFIRESRQAAEGNVHREWSSNEKTALESALGMSYAGKRCLVTMKHVGLNVAADPFMNSAFVGVNGGMIIAVADDPSMHSSQNEQDSRVFAEFAKLPILEPSNQQECYDMAFAGFELSEKFRVPVLFRITTRLAHSRSGVVRRDPIAQKSLKLPEDIKGFILLPAIARRRQKELFAKQPGMEQDSVNSPFNTYIDGPDKSLGIIACGLAYNYLWENFTDKPLNHPVVKVSQYPLPRNLIQKIAGECKALLVLEEGFPIVEEQLRGYLNNNLTVHGRLDGTLPRDGELTPNLVAKALGLPATEGMPVPPVVVGRPPALCVGCPHIDSFNTLKTALKELGHGDGHVFSDIGCYTLGALPPYEAINSCVDMGASVTMAKGAADAGLFPAIAVIGDSTFTHSGMTGLLDCVLEKSNVVIVILDNFTTAMTGGQPSAANQRLVEICAGLGVERDHIRVVLPLPKNHAEIIEVFKQEINYNGVSVVIPQRECVQTLKRKFNAGKGEK